MNMSKPKAPYYYNKNKDTYHWELHCSKNKYTSENRDWVKTNIQPKKEQCNECKSK